MKKHSFLFHKVVGVGVVVVIATGCFPMTTESSNWKQDAHSLALLPIGLEFTENVTNVTKQIDGKGAVSNRFQGIDFFVESFNSMSKQERPWYAILYCAQHQLDGEYLLTFRITTKSEIPAIRALARRLKGTDWAEVGVCLGVDGQLARRRVNGVFAQQ